MNFYNGKNILLDRFGRVAVMRASAFLTVLSGIAIAFSQNVYVFGFLRFLMAVLSMPLYGAAVVYGKRFLAHENVFG